MALVDILGRIKLKKLIYLLLLVSLCRSAIAEQPSDYDKQAITNCLAITELAESAMKARQNRVPITEMYKTISSQDIDIKEIATVVINSAYRTPLAMSKEEAELVVLEYTNNFFSDCLRHLSTNKAP